MTNAIPAVRTNPPWGAGCRTIAAQIITPITATEPIAIAAMKPVDNSNCAVASDTGNPRSCVA